MILPKKYQSNCPWVTYYSFGTSLANKLAGSPVLDTYGPEERRAIWALQDLCELALEENGITPRPEADWNRLIQAAREHVKHIPVEFGDS
jgi:hypothetical protein